MDMGLCGRWPVSRRAATSWDPERCTTICKDCSIKGSWKSVPHALSAMIQGAAIIACHVLAADSWLRRSRDSKTWSAKRDYISNHVPRGHDEPHLVSLAHLFASTRLSSAVRARTSLDIRRIQRRIRPGGAAPL